MRPMIKIYDNKDAIHYFKENDILLVTVFGSYLDERFIKGISDIDIAMLFEEDIGILDEVKIIDDLSKILNFEDIDLLNLNKANFMLKYNAVIRGKIIYEKDRNITDNFIESILFSYRLHYYRYNSMQKEFIQNLIEG
ncbi:MAG TPA: nucleotidyltransferase domain-containing protein [Thermoanaerobacterales bacterium]|jgi:predicted nucleotidyltransferase|nr:nucleotidyltransferase domain-containing protein [Thermoanaerobacterales bacterium]